MQGWSIDTGERSRPPKPGSTHATALLQSSLLALSGGRPITDVTLSGAARRIAGSDDESCTVVIKAVAGTGSRIESLFPHVKIDEFYGATGQANL